MAYFRFHRSRAVLPGIRVNLSKSGPSLSIGPKGAKVNIGPQGIRTTVGLPGSGLSAINRISYFSKTKNEIPKPKQRRPRLNTVVDEVMDHMTKDQKREFFAKCVMEAPLDEVKAQRAIFEAHIIEHASEIEESDRADLDTARRIYVEAIAIKESEARQNLMVPLGLVAIACIAMWGGVETGNGWLIAGSLISCLVAAGTDAGQRALYNCMKLLLGIFGLAIAALVIGVLTLVVLAATGNLK